MNLLEKTLKQSGTTRWNSHLQLFKSILCNWTALDKTIDDIDNSREEVRTLYEHIKKNQVVDMVNILEVRD